MPLPTLKTNSAFENVLAQIALVSECNTANEQNAFRIPMTGATIGLLHFLGFKPIVNYSQMRTKTNYFYPDFSYHKTSELTTTAVAQLFTEQLGLSRNSSLFDLRQARRRFAMLNHPDRVPDRLRGISNERMTIANELIDEMIRDKQKLFTDDTRNI
jgi:hypothetical protein